MQIKLVGRQAHAAIERVTLTGIVVPGSSVTSPRTVRHGAPGHEEGVNDFWNEKRPAVTISSSGLRNRGCSRF